MSGVIDNCKLTLKLDLTQLSALDLAAVVATVAQDFSQTLTNGTGAGQASMSWSDQRTLTASATENLDLAGSLTSAFGATITFTKIKLILVRASVLNNAANNVNVSRGSSNGVAAFLAASDGMTLSAGGVFLWFDPAGVTVGAGTSDILTITNSAGTNSVVYDVVLIGTD
jgi:hypothetical protein